MVMSNTMDPASGAISRFESILPRVTADDPTAGGQA